MGASARSSVVLALLFCAASQIALAQAQSPGSASSSLRPAASSLSSAPGNKPPVQPPVISSLSSDASKSAALTSTIAPSQMSQRLLNQMDSDQGILSQSKGHKHGIITRALGGVASDIGHATVALVGTTILNQGTDLPPDDSSNPEWPFNEPNRKALYYVNWADGSSSKISRLPDGTVQILGSGRRIMLQPEGDGAYAMFGDFGSLATVTPRLDGGYTIIRADGITQQILPRAGGGFNVCNSRGAVLATILPGVGGSKHIRGSSVSHGFLE